MLSLLQAGGLSPGSQISSTSCQRELPPLASCPELALTISSSWMSQTLVYWVLGQFASDVTTNARTGGVFRSWETVGQAISYGINSKVANKFVPFGIYFGLYVVAMPLFWVVLQDLPVESKVPNVVDEDGVVIEDSGKGSAVLARDLE